MCYPGVSGLRGVDIRLEGCLASTQPHCSGTNAGSHHFGCLLPVIIGTSQRIETTRTAVLFRTLSDPTVRRLSGLDAGFLSLELAEQPMQCIAIGVLRCSGNGSLSFQDLRAHVAARLGALPALRWRVVPVPLGLAQPVFVDDLRFNLDDHLFHAVLPAPGGVEELDAACAQLASRHLDRDRPLWRMTLVDGLADGRQALVLEIHHALMDGAAIRTTLTRIFGPVAPALSPRSGRPGRMPTPGQLIASGLAHDARTLARLPDLIGREMRARVAVRRRQAHTAAQMLKSDVDAPPSHLNDGFTPERRFARAALPLETVRAVKDAARVTVNDVALAVVGGALRGYLQVRGAASERSLAAFVPVGMTEFTTTPRAEGNRFSWLATSLSTDVADPWERLRRIGAATAEAKACLHLASRKLMADRLECFPPMLMDFAVRQHQRARRRTGRRRCKIGEDVVVSNLRGSPTPWQLGSAVVEEMYLAGPPNGDTGVTIALWDYAGQLLFGILAFADLIDDPQELAAGLSRSLEELLSGAWMKSTNPNRRA